MDRLLGACQREGGKKGVKWRIQSFQHCESVSAGVFQGNCHQDRLPFRAEGELDGNSVVNKFFTTANVSAETFLVIIGPCREEVLVFPLRDGLKDYGVLNQVKTFPQQVLCISTHDEAHVLMTLRCRLAHSRNDGITAPWRKRT